MAGVQVIWFSVLVTCIYANVTTLQHFLSIYCQYAHFFCIHQGSVHVVHYKSNDQLNLIGTLNVWRPCKWFTFHWYVLMCCVLTTQRQFSTTFGLHWNVIYTLINTAGEVHYAAFSQHLLPICTRFLYTSGECACGTLQIKRPIKSKWLIKRMATVQVIHISLQCSYVLRPNNWAALLDHFRSTLKRHLYIDKYSRWGTL